MLYHQLGRDKEIRKEVTLHWISQGGRFEKQEDHGGIPTGKIRIPKQRRREVS